MSEYQTRQKLETNLVAKAWQDETFKQQLMSAPKSVISEAGLSLPDDIEVKVMEETNQIFYLVISQPPSQAEELSEADLESVAGGFCVDVKVDMPGGWKMNVTNPTSHNEY